VLLAVWVAHPQKTTAKIAAQSLSARFEKMFAIG
jgi:hypothetical protein